MIALAVETGWSERFIREELPLARFLLYKHALHWRAGDWTVPPSPPVDEQVDILGL